MTAVVLIRDKVYPSIRSIGARGWLRTPSTRWDWEGRSGAHDLLFLKCVRILTPSGELFWQCTVETMKLLFCRLDCA